jgi:RimJ/RimL family protein N-acetyltransferase
LKRERREVADGGDRDAVKERLMAVCEPENKGSLRVLEKCGFKEVRRFVFEANGDALVEFCSRGLKTRDEQVKVCS